MVGFLLGALAGYIWMRGFIVPIIRAMIEYTPARELRRRERYKQNWRERHDKAVQLATRMHLESIERASEKQKARLARLQAQQRTGRSWLFFG